MDGVCRSLGASFMSFPSFASPVIPFGFLDLSQVPCCHNTRDRCAPFATPSNSHQNSFVVQRKRKNNSNITQKKHSRPSHSSHFLWVCPQVLPQVLKSKTCPLTHAAAESLGALTPLSRHDGSAELRSPSATGKGPLRSSAAVGRVGSLSRDSPDVARVT